MKILIIEDERLTAEDLKDMLLEAEPAVQILAIVPSVREAVHYLQQNPQPDLIFSDIQLGDGLSFEVFEQVPVEAPIIFCTAYSEYAIEAFKTNGIHYVLKPFDEPTIAEALGKYKSLQKSFKPRKESFDNLLQLFENQREPKVSSLLVYKQDKIIPVKLEEIAVVYIRQEITHIYTFDGKTYTVNKTLDDVHQLVGNLMYRANRQYLIARGAVSNVSQYLARKVSINLNVAFEDVITVSKEKVSDFLEWLEGN